MSDPENDQTEEEQLEKALDETPTATPANDPAEAEPDPGEDGPEPPGRRADPPPDETPASDAAPAKRKPRTQAQKEKRKADTERRKKAIADAPRPPDPSKEDEAEQKRKVDLREKMAEIQGEIDDLEAAVDERKEALTATSSELYPHLVRSDHHVDAVRGYIASQKELRRTRASNPARIKAILEAAGRAPIDLAFRAQRARGAKRPVRPQAGLKPTGGDAAPGADKPKAKTGSE